MRTAEAALPRSALSRDDWIDAAIDALAGHGANGVRIETLAKTLKVTKGSFYWHFSTRDDLLLAVLEQWKDGRIKDIIKQTRAAPGREREQLRHVLSTYSIGRSRKGMRIELAMRDWASRDQRAAATVRAVDATRFSEARQLFLACGMSAHEASSRSIMLYAYVFGQSLMDCEKFDADVIQARDDAFELIMG